MTNSLRVGQWRLPDSALVVFVVAGSLVIGSVFVAEFVSEDKAREKLVDAVIKASAVRLNGQEVDDPAVLLATLQRMEHVSAHHSHPTVPVQIELAGRAETTSVVIARDSERPTEFWVFRPGANWHRDSLGQSAGRITSADLDQFLRKRGL